MGIVVFSQWLRSTGENMDLRLLSEVGTVLWDLGLNLWELMLPLGILWGLSSILGSPAGI